jgi:hypothetical protein
LELPIAIAIAVCGIWPEGDTVAVSVPLNADAKENLNYDTHDTATSGKLPVSKTFSAQVDRVSAKYFAHHDQDYVSATNSPRQQSEDVAADQMSEGPFARQESEKEEKASFVPAGVSEHPVEVVATPAGELPPGLKVLMFANFAFMICITTFEATLVPMLHSRFNGSKTAANLTFAGIGVFVLISSVLTKVLESFGITKFGVLLIGAAVFMFGTIASIDFSPPYGLAVFLEVVSCILCASGFTLAFVKIPDLFAGLVVAQNDPSLLMKMGQLMGLLSIGSSLARACGPIILGYGLHSSINTVIIMIASVLLLVCVVLALTRKHLIIPVRRVA